MGKGKFRALNRFQWNLDYTTTSWVWPHMQINMRCDNVGGLGEHVTCHMFGFLVYISTFFLHFFALFFGSRRALTSRPILSIYTSYDMFPHKEVPLGSRSHCSHCGGQIPESPCFGDVNDIPKLNARKNIKTCILSKLLHQSQPNFA